MKKYLSYDIEIYNDLPTGGSVDLHNIIPSIAAITSDYEHVRFYSDIPFMGKKTAKKLVYDMYECVENGYTIFGWNSCSFDFPLLAFYSEEIDMCSRLCLNSVDGMFLVVCNKGHFLGLDAALIGSHLETKVHSVVLNDGSIFSEMNGSKAPMLYRKGEYKATEEYLFGDVVQPLKLAYEIEKQGGIRWTSKAGKQQFLRTKMLTVKECLKLELPDTSWMSEPKKREDFYSWIPQEVLRKEGVI